jgi:hypothetical protein
MPQGLVPLDQGMVVGPSQGVGRGKVGAGGDAIAVIWHGGAPGFGKQLGKVYPSDLKLRTLSHETKIW